jgi:hypothetical protein
MFLGLDLKAWLGLSVLGAIVSTIGALIGIVIRDYFFSRSFERWKQQRSLEQIYQKFSDPLLLSALELTSRSIEILKNFPTVYLKKSVLASRPEKQLANTIHDPYFQRYKLISTAYRLSAFLAWLELYRQEITFLNSGSSKNAKTLELAIERVRGDFADGHINHSKDWDKWRDELIFREELRAIGESLIETRGNNRTVMGYGRYCEQLESPSANNIQHWSKVVFNFYLELENSGKDFRQIRMKRQVVHLVEIMQLLDSSAIEPKIKEAYGKLLPEIDEQ